MVKKIMVLLALWACATSQVAWGQLDCSDAQSLIPGTVQNGTTVNGQSHSSGYACSGWTESGPERVYVVDVSATPCTISLMLTNLTANLDVFLLSGCDSGACLAYGDNALTFTATTAGTYYVVVDGRSGAAGTFTLLLCATLGAAELSTPPDSAIVCSGVVYSYAWNPVPFASSYTIQWDDNSAFSSPIQQTTPSLSTTYNLSVGGNWYWRVRANNAGTCPAGGWSAPRLIALTPAPGQASQIGPPTGMTICSGAAQNYSWSAAPNATSYTVYWDEEGLFSSPDSQTVTSTSVSHAITGAGTWYWKVRSNNVCGMAAWSAVRTVAITPIPGQANLSSPANDAIVCSGYSQLYIWSVVGNATSYTVQWDDNDLFTSPDEQTVNTASANRSLAGTGNRYWRVRSNNSCGSSAWSSSRVISLTPLPATPAPVAPSNGTTICSGVSQEYSWNPVDYAATYTIQWDDNAGFISPDEQTITGTSITKTITGLVTWYWRVRSNNTCGSSTYSTIRALTLTMNPAQVMLFSPADGIVLCTGSSQVFTWTTASFAADYTIQIDDSSSFPSPEETTITATSMTITLTGGETRYWRVRGNNLCGSGAWSPARTLSLIPTPGDVALTAPVDGALISSDMVTTYSWSAAPGATSYTVQWDDNTAFSSPVQQTVSGTSISQALSGVGPWHWHVRGNNTCGGGAWSSSRSITLVSGLVPPTVVIWMAGDSARLSWAPVAGATSYQVQTAQELNGPYTVLTVQPDTTHGMVPNGLWEPRYFRVVAQTP